MNPATIIQIEGSIVRLSEGATCTRETLVQQVASLYGRTVEEVEGAISYSAAAQKALSKLKQKDAVTTSGPAPAATPQMATATSPLAPASLDLPQQPEQPARPVKDAASAMYDAIRNNNPVGAAYGMPEFFEQFSKDHSLSDEEVRALWLEQQEAVNSEKRWSPAPKAPGSLALPVQQLEPAQAKQQVRQPEQPAPSISGAQAQANTAERASEGVKGTFPRPDFLATATKVIGWGGHIMWCKEGVKFGMPDGWQNMASRDMAQVEKWSQEDPHRNIILVGKPDGLLSFDDDTDVLERYETKYGKIETTRQRSVSGGQHLIFKQTDATRAFGNFGKKDGEHELWSVRANNRYIVGFGSTAHPNNDPKLPLAQYELVDDRPPIEMPERFLLFLRADAELSSEPRVVVPIGTAEQEAVGAKVEAVLSASGKDFKARVEYQGGFKWLNDCPWKENHTWKTKPVSEGGSSSAVIMWPNGEVSLECTHNNCEKKTWTDFCEYAQQEADKAADAASKPREALPRFGAYVGSVPPGSTTAKEAKKNTQAAEEAKAAEAASKGTVWFSYDAVDGDGRRTTEYVTFAYPAIHGTHRDYVVAPALGQRDGWFPLGAPSALAGSSGTGKTTWFMDVLEKQKVREPVWGHGTYGRSYLVIMVDRGEESNRRTLERLDLDPNKIPVKYIQPVIDAEAMIEIKKRIEEDGADAVSQIVFIEGADMLVRDVSKGPYVIAFLKRLQRLAEHYHMAVVLSLGSPKQKIGEGYVTKRDSILGSEKWGRMSETVVIMSFVKQDDMGKKRVCSVQPRNAPPEEFKLMMTQTGKLVPDTTDPQEPIVRRPEIDWFKDQAAEGKTDPSKRWWTALDLQRGLNVSQATASRWIKDALAKQYTVKKPGRKDAKGCAEQYQWNESVDNPLWVPPPPEEQAETEPTL